MTKIGDRFIYIEHAGASAKTGEIVEISPAGRLAVRSESGVRWFAGVRDIGIVEELPAPTLDSIADSIALKIATGELKDEPAQIVQDGIDKTNAESDVANN